MPVTFDDYADKYANVRMERDDDGVLELTLHSDGAALRWGFGPLSELPRCFADVGADPENKLVILTGTGDAFIGHREPASGTAPSPQDWGATLIRSSVHLNRNLLDIDVPTIAAINGPCTSHAELALLCDIVLATEDTSFRDAAHFRRGLVPGDGVHVVWPMLLGPNRARYFLLTGQTISAQEALQLGVVNEVLPREALLPRARELAEYILERPPLTVRLTRTAITQELRRQMQAYHAYGETLTALAGVDAFPDPQPDEI